MASLSEEKENECLPHRDILRVCSETNQGMRRYMEDEVSVVIEEGKRTAFLGVFDGHGGKEASIFARDNLYTNIKNQPGFYDTDAEKVKLAIRNGFVATHWQMFHEVENWPKRKDGQNSTSGTTATVAIIRDQKMYIAHVGDSAAILASKEDENFVCRELTVDHKPDSVKEKSRIENLGGRVVKTNGVPRVVWKRAVRSCSPIDGEVSTRYEYVPFLAVSRALGDVWSYDTERREFIVSPEPEIEDIDLIPGHHKFVLLASDGLWGVMNGQDAVDIVTRCERSSSKKPKQRNCSHTLINETINLWHKKRSRADNISAIVAFLDDEFDACCEPSTTLINEDEADTDVISDVDDDTPPMSKSSSTFSLVRQIAFQGAHTISPKVSLDDVSEKLKTSSNEIAASSDQDIEISSTPDASGKRKIDAQDNRSEKKVRTTLAGTPSAITEDSHQCHIITVLSSESLCDLQLDEDLGLADDESDDYNTTTIRNPLRNPLSAHALPRVVRAKQ
ncbi:protein phosphatase 1D-like [Hydractinia symbiolongicarpus]|uniref:protein phosphatase 1D-like n=1 Tax=Hydractinia symbiolongicarpus TaxID=13093 RepID=UPI002550FCA1|nr:protein phosphatase 1D-like [Hydractinia symbiolongicarpus]